LRFWNPETEKWLPTPDEAQETLRFEAEKAKFEAMRAQAEEARERSRRELAEAEVERLRRELEAAKAITE
jgi:hypothetical protein